MAGAADFCDNNLFYVDVLACVNIHRTLMCSVFLDYIIGSKLKLLSDAETEIN